MTAVAVALTLVVALAIAAIAGLECTGDYSPVASLSAPRTQSTLAPGGPTTSSSFVRPTTSSSAAAPTTTVAPTTTTTAAPRPPLAFSTTQAMRHLDKLASDIGIRPGGSAAEAVAADYAAGYLEGLGYDPVFTEVPLPNGKMSHNVTVTKEGSSALTVLIGAHLDTKRTTPGGNDNASGVAAALELARDVAEADLTPTIVFVLFGTEEIIDADKTHHHYGSRDWAERMTDAEKDKLVAMISLDMVGYGQTFHVRTMGKGPLELSDMLLSYAGETDVDLVYLRDTGPTGWSDHEPFELAGYPSVWLQWHEDPEYHKAGDTYEHCDERPVQETGRFVLDFLTDLDQPDLERLRAAVRQ
jgi:hypothetical protein